MRFMHGVRVFGVCFVAVAMVGLAWGQGPGSEPRFGAGPEGNQLIERFSELGFERVEAKELVPGAPQKMKITSKTLAKLKKLMEEGKGVSIGDGGDVEIVDLKK